MTDVASALRELAEPWSPGDRIKACIDRAARRAGLSYWRTFDLWYSKARRIEQYELDAISDAILKKRREAARNELQDLQLRIARLEARLSQTDPDFHRVDLDVLRQGARPVCAQADRLGRMGRAANQADR